MPQKYCDYTERSGDYSRSFADLKGPSIRGGMDSILDSRQVEQQSYRTCRALLSLSVKHGFGLFEEACRKAAKISNRPSYKTVKTLV